MKDPVELMEDNRYEEAIPIWLAKIPTVSDIPERLGFYLNLAICYIQTDLLEYANVAIETVFDTLKFKTNYTSTDPGRVDIGHRLPAYYCYVECLYRISTLDYGSAKFYLGHAKRELNLIHPELKIANDDRLSLKFQETLDYLSKADYPFIADRLETLYKRG